MCVANAGSLRVDLLNKFGSSRSRREIVPVSCDGGDYRFDPTCLTTAWQLERAGIRVTNTVYREGIITTTRERDGKMAPDRLWARVDMCRKIYW
jgi:hypothetical protein